MPGLSSSQEFREELAELDECARRALEISFSRVELNNLDRARLLDILLWAGDLTTALRHRRTAPPDLPGPVRPCAEVRETGRPVSAARARKLWRTCAW